MIFYSDGKHPICYSLCLLAFVLAGLGWTAVMYFNISKLYGYFLFGIALTFVLVTTVFYILPIYTVTVGDDGGVAVHCILMKRFSVLYTFSVSDVVGVKKYGEYRKRGEKPVTEYTDTRFPRKNADVIIYSVCGRNVAVVLPEMKGLYRYFSDAIK